MMGRGHGPHIREKDQQWKLGLVSKGKMCSADILKPGGTGQPVVSLQGSKEINTGGLSWYRPFCPGFRHELLHLPLCQRVLHSWRSLQDSAHSPATPDGPTALPEIAEPIRGRG